MFSSAAFTSGSAFSWPGPADFFCGLAKAGGALAKTSTTAIIKIVLAGTILFIFLFLIRSAAKGWIA
jgi:hypothetical protein